MIDCSGRGGSSMQDEELRSSSCSSEDRERFDDDGFPFARGARISLRGAKRVALPVQSGAAEWKRSPLGQIKLLDLKAKLSKILGPRKEKEYCKLFSSFLSQRLTKAELDKRLLLTLGCKDNIVLHNQIVKAVLANASRGRVREPPPRSSDGNFQARAPITPEEDHQREDKRFKPSSLVGDEEEAAEDERAPIGVPLCIQSVGSASRRRHPGFSIEELRREAEESGCDLPDDATMRARMELLSAGLEVRSESANVVNLALDVHLKRLIAACIKSGRRSSSKIITPLDFRVAIEGIDSRQLLGENFPIQLERLSLMLRERD